MNAPVSDPDTAARMHAIAAALTGAGLAAQVNQANGVLDITASFGQPGGKPIKVIMDEDTYVQVSYWNPPAATPAQVTATIAAVLAAITTKQSLLPD
jgi:hypothetical protein